MTNGAFIVQNPTQMSRKQEIYKEILRWALPSSRASLSQFWKVRPFVVLAAERQRALREGYEIAQFVHNLYVSILEEEFTRHDIDFLNVQARHFVEDNSGENGHLYSMFVYFIQELFKAVPEEKRDKLTWNGPESDYSWARPAYFDEGISSGTASVSSVAPPKDN